MIDWFTIGFYAFVFVLAVVLSVPVWMIAEAIVFRFTKSTGNKVLIQLVFAPLMGGLAAAWGLPHASMFSDIHSQNTSTEILFLALAGSAFLTVMNLFGMAVIGAFYFIVVAIRGSEDQSEGL